MSEPAAPEKIKTKNLKPRGWLGKIFGRHAPLWVKLIRTPVLGLAAVMTIDTAVLPQMPGRALTPGEGTMLREVYGDSIDYARVRVHQSPAADVYLSIMGQTAVTKGNVIFLETATGTDDIAKSGDTYLQYTLTHEGGHVWQGQNGVMPNAFSRMALNLSRFLPGDDKHGDYRYSVLEGKDLLQYNVEQQASIITEFHFLSKGLQDPLFNSDAKAKPADVKAGYEATLKNFHANPSYPKK